MTEALIAKECLPSDCPIKKTNIGIYIMISDSGKVYVGQSSNLKKRKYEHFRLLKKNEHDNKYLQNSYNKYGDLLHFTIEWLEDVSMLTEREQYWVAAFNSYECGMNLTPAAGTSIGCVRSVEQRKVISDISREFWSKEENRLAQSERKKEFHKNNPDHLLKMSKITTARFKDRPELLINHSTLMKERSSTPESIQVFKDVMIAWRGAITPEESTAIAMKAVATKGAVGIHNSLLKAASTRLVRGLPRAHGSTGVLGVQWVVSESRNGTPRLDAQARWTEPMGKNRIKSFSVAKYGLLPAFAMACAYRESVTKRLVAEYEEIISNL